MATRTQKAAKKTKADAAKASGTPKATTSAKPKSARPKKTAKAAKAAAKAEPFEPVPEPKPTLGERFWHRIGLGAKAKEERAHKLAVEHEAALQLKIEQDRRDRERAEEDQRAARRAHAAAERKADEKAAREMARLAREEDARLKREAEEAAARAATQAAEDRKAAAAARREAARTAKLREAAQAQLAAQEKAEAAAARREAARLAREQAKADAEREAEAKAEERRFARQRKAEEKAREEELTRLEEEAQARRNAPKVDVELREKSGEPLEAMEDAEEGEAVEAEMEPGAGEEVAIDESPEEPAEREAVAKPSRKAAKNGAARKAAKNGAVPKPAMDTLESQADRVAEELRSRRSKPITIDADDEPAPMLPVGRKSREEESKQVLQLDPAPPARMEVAAPRGLSIPEHFLLLALEDGWDERREKAAPGALGGALVGSLLLELALQGKLSVQRDRFQLTDAAVDDAAAAVVQRIKPIQGRPSLQVMGELAKALPQLLPAYKDRMAARGLIEHRAWRHLGMFYRSQTALVDGDAQERLRNKLARAIAGGGRPDAPTILSLGLLEACGRFGLVVPEGAQAYNRKRLNGLLAGKDVMGYKVDDELKGMQEVAVRTILDNVRLMTVRG